MRNQFASPLEDQVLIELDTAEKETKGGIILPDSAQKKSSTGVVVAVGPGKWSDRNDRHIPVSCEVGQTVLFQKYHGSEVEINGRELLAVRESDIIAVLKPAANG